MRIPIRNKHQKALEIVVFTMTVLSFLGLQAQVTEAEIFDCSKYLKTSVASTADCDQKTGDQKTQCEAFDKKAKAYCDLVEIKSKTQSTLKNQLTLIDAQQTKAIDELKKTQEKVKVIGENIENLDNEIKDKDKIIKYQQTILAGLIQSYYDYNQDGMLQIVLLKENLSNFFTQTDQLQQASSNVNDVLRDIQIAKNELEREYQEIADKKKESEDLKKQLEEKTDNLQYSEQQKKVLLTQTQGEEQKYRDLLARVEQQKIQLFDFSSASNSDELIASVSSYAKPPSKYWASDWYFSQRDSRWGGQSIGNSKTLMSGYGCAVTALAMVFREKGAAVDPGKMAKQPIFSYDLIKWPGSWSPGITLTSSIGHVGVNWNTVNAEVAKGNPVIVYIRKTNGKGGHYVVIHHYDSAKKDYVVNDPYFGANLYLGTSKVLVGKIGVDSGVVLDQMIIYKK
jgi:peptidoglycan hydrolase CwlO-like protein